MQVNVEGTEACSVHGHPRLSNIYVRQSVVNGATATDADFMFVNFDWAGHNGVATYPATVVTKEQHHGDVGPLRSITQQLDREVLLASLRGAAAAADVSNPLTAGASGHHQDHDWEYSSARAVFK